MCMKLAFLLFTCLFLSATSTSVLNCTLNTFGECVVISIDPITQADEVITMAGQPSTYVNPTVKKMGFYGKFSLQYVPTGLLTMFPNLTYFEILNCGTTTLVTDAYKNCNNLQSTILEGGKIANVPAGIASTCSNIVSMSLGNNSIESIDANAFQGLTGLKVLKLDINQLTCIPPTLFQNVKAIGQITMSLNLITAIDSKIISGLPNLYMFEISGNQLTYLPLLDLTGTGTTSNFGNFGFNDNPINAINPQFTSIFTSRTSSFDIFFMSDLPCLPAGTTTFGITTSDYMNSSAALATCFSNYDSSTMSESAPCPLVTTTVAPSSLPDLICVSYPEWKEILKNFHLPQWKKRCPRFHRHKVCLHICFFIPGGDGDNDRDDNLAFALGQTYKPDHSTKIPHTHHGPGNLLQNKPIQGLLQQIKPGKKPFKG
ncbi:leucine-rich repeat-containing G-protein coupled receptor 5-like [Chironomus tepperi]|uniref:leucine-rich repeat-containing G-protein coupled receptor 5-like n=1 Tax=Chironomus tepperi TaxID=113505 RepID=UPI00391F7145